MFLFHHLIMYNQTWYHVINTQGPESECRMQVQKALRLPPQELRCTGVMCLFSAKGGCRGPWSQPSLLRSTASPEGHLAAEGGKSETGMKLFR